MPITLEDQDGATSIAERMIIALRRPFSIVGKEVFIGASIGVMLKSAAPFGSRVPAA